MRSLSTSTPPAALPLRPPHVAGPSRRSLLTPIAACAVSGALSPLPGRRYPPLPGGMDSRPRSQPFQGCSAGSNPAGGISARVAARNPHGYVGQSCQVCRKCAHGAYLGAYLGNCRTWQRAGRRSSTRRARPHHTAGGSCIRSRRPSYIVSTSSATPASASFGLTLSGQRRTARGRSSSRSSTAPTDELAVPRTQARASRARSAASVAGRRGRGSGRRSAPGRGCTSGRRRLRCRRARAPGCGRCRAAAGRWPS